MSDLVIAGGTVVGPGGVRRADVRVADGRVVAVGAHVDHDGAAVLDATGAWVGPGFVDLHAHLREPGGEGAETIASGARAAAIGGYSALVAMPNTDPPIDSALVARAVLALGATAPVAVAVAGTITVGRAGEHLAPFAELAAVGVRLFTDDGSGVQDAAVMRRAMSYAASLGVRLAQHCEESSLAAGGVMNEGPLASRLGLAGRPALAEELMVFRDLQLAALTGCPLHLLHLSTAGSLALAAEAKRRGVPVTVEVAPHHFTLDESACASFDPIYKVHPPLRSITDVAAVRAGLRTVVDAVATDHAPHAAEDKDLPFADAPPGMLGLEHAASLTLEAIGDDEPVLLFSLLSRRPAAIAQLGPLDGAAQGGHGGSVVVGEHANLVVFDPSARYRVDRTALQSRATNTPYHGRELRGRARHLVVAGRRVLVNGELR